MELLLSDGREQQGCDVVDLVIWSSDNENVNAPGFGESSNSVHE
jgi:hypothetical protein